MRAVDLIRAVRDKAPVAPDDLSAFVAGVSSGEIPDYQASAFLMAAWLNGLSKDLTVALTLSMRDSGIVVDWGDVPGPKVDKHSTGGVGDKISIPLAPLVAACGVHVPMISGRGLGHTGGTLDKLESIPGFRVDLGVDRFVQLVGEHGLALIGQTDDLAPADRKLYALRDVTATVESVPLITASILSKKLAEGLDGLVLDVKVGRGAFMKDEASARELAQSLVDVGTGAGVKVRAVMTRMEAPLGRTVGNALEIVESIEILRGEGPEDTTQLTRVLGGEMLTLAGVVDNPAAGEAKIQGAIESGAGLERLAKLVEAQGGDPTVVEDPSRLPAADAQTEVTAQADGFVASIDSYALGLAGMRLGGGRATAADEIDPAVGFEIVANVGSPVKAGEPLIVVHHRTGKVDLPAVAAVFRVDPQPPAVGPLVIDRIG